MRNIFRSFWAGLVLGLMATGAIAPVLALTIPPTYGPRYFQTQQVHYIRFLLNVTSSGCIVNNEFTGVISGGICSVKVGALPYNAFVLRVTQQTVVATNAVTAGFLSLGTASGGAQLVLGAAGANGNTQAVTGAVTDTVVAANAGIAATGNGIAATGADGGFDLWVTETQTGGNGTAGTIVVVVEFFANNDGACLPGSNAPGFTAPAC